MKKIAYIIVLALGLSACQTIYFEKKDSGGSTEITDSSWHHGGIFGFVQFSNPYDPKAACSGDWSAVKIEQSFVQGLLTGATYYLYAPWTAGARCAK
ncbi:MAG: hypothetical protein AB7T49_14195 [Oligoflexales bacterium]